MAAMDPIVISVTADIGPLQTGMGSAVNAFAAAEKAAASLDRQTQQYLKTTTATQRQLDSLIGVQKNFAASAQASAAAFKEFDAAKAKIDSLRASIDPLFASSKRYEAALVELDSALASGVIKTSEYNAMVNHLGAAYLTAAPKMGEAVGHISGIGTASKLSYMQVQELGHITRSFVDVIAAGGSPMRAFQFEGMRIAEVLAQGGGPIATIKAMGATITEFLGPVGMGIIGVGLLGAAIYEFVPRATTFAQAIKNATADNTEYGKSFQALVTDMDAAKSLQSEYIAAVQSGSAETIEAIKKEAAIRVNLLELDKLQLQEDSNKAGAAAAASDEALKRSQQAVDQLQAQIDKLNAMNPSEYFGGFATAKEEAASLLPILEAQTTELKKQTSSNEKNTLEWQLIGSKIEANNSKLALTEALTKSIAGGAASLAGSWGDAAGAAAAFAKNVQAAAAAQAAIGSPLTKFNNFVKASEGNKGRGVTEASGGPVARDSSGDVIDIKPHGKGRSGGGGGGGGKDPLLGNLKTLQDSLKTATQIEMDNYTSRQKTLDEALSKRKISQTDYMADVQLLQKKHADTMVKLDVWQYGTTLDKAGDFFGQMAGALQSGNQRMQDIGKKFGAVEALINSWRAFAQVLGHPEISPWVKIPLAMSVLSAGMGAVNAIKGGGSGGGGGGSAGYAAAAGHSSGGQAAQPGTYMNFNFQGAYGSTEDFGRFMVSAINKAVENGAVIRGARIA